MVVNEGTFDNSGAYSSMFTNCGTSSSGAVLVINGGNFSGGSNTLKNDDYGTLYINGGTFTNANQSCLMNYNVAYITGGTFDGTSAKATIYNSTWGTVNNNTPHDVTPDAGDQGQLYISGGAFTSGSKGVILYNDYYDASGRGTVYVLKDSTVTFLANDGTTSMETASILPDGNGTLDTSSYNKEVKVTEI